MSDDDRVIAGKRSRVRFISTLMSMLAHVVVGITLAALAFPWLADARRERVIRWWARRLLAILGVRVRLFGPPSSGLADRAAVENTLELGGPGVMLVMNHISWLDIFVVHSRRPARFIAKAEISRWPLLGFLVDRSGTIFIERDKRHAVREINRRIAASLEQGRLVGLFPEGTTSDGNHLLPFHANLMQPAINVGAPIVVVGVRYLDEHGGPTDATLYTGDITLLQSLLRLARRGPLVAELHLIDLLDSRGATRHEIGRKARGLIATTLDLDDEASRAADVSQAPAPAGSGPGTPFDPRAGSP